MGSLGSSYTPWWTPPDVLKPPFYTDVKTYDGYFFLSGAHIPNTTKTYDGYFFVNDKIYEGGKY